MHPLRKPYSLQELKDKTAKDEDRFLTAVVAIDFDDLVTHDIEWLNETCSEMITGSDVAMEDIGYMPVGAEGGEVLVQVTGSILNWLTNQE